MKNILKKSLIVSIIASSMAMLNMKEISAYSNDDEELVIPYKTQRTAISKSEEFTVVIDAGHGGSDSGAVNKNLNILEKNLNIDIAKSIQKRLESYGIKVLMTRTNDASVSLGERTQFANSKNADLFVSVHNDTPEGNGNGAHIIHSIHDKKGGISKTLATNIGNSIKSNTIQNLKSSSPIWSRYYPDRNDLDYYYVIRETNMPAVIVEHAYMNNNDIQAVNTAQKREVMGQAVADGIYKTINENFSGWVRVKTKWNYYDSTTKTKKVGWLKDANKWYYLDATGEMQTGWEYVGGKWYYLEPSGAMKTGWIKDNGIWYFLDSSGAMKTGWLRDNGVWYYLESNGAMKTGWVKDNGVWYYLESNGAMKTGWLRDNGVWYYLESNGAMKTGWVKDNGVWYYLESNGAMKIGWLKDNDIWYYLSPSGAMQTGWIEVDSKKYYLNENGEMQVGWLEYKENWYHLSNSGAMQTGTIEINGEKYNFNENGELISKG